MKTHLTLEYEREHDDGTYTPLTVKCTCYPGNPGSWHQPPEPPEVFTTDVRDPEGNEVFLSDDEGDDIYELALQHLADGLGQ
jgi:hypothetical protein